MKKKLVIVGNRVVGFVTKHRKALAIGGVVAVGSMTASAVGGDPTTITAAASTAFDGVTTLVVSMVSFGVIVGIIRKIHIG